MNTCLSKEKQLGTKIPKLNSRSACVGAVLKPAFTLTETLVALCIVGIIAAITLPIINHVKPDKNKIMYLKAYDSIMTATKSLVSDSSLFAATRVYNDASGKTYNIDITKYPLLDYESTKNEIYHNSPNHRGNVKFCNLLKDSFHNVTVVHSCSVHSSDNDLTSQSFDENYNFVTANGMQWWVQPYRPDPIVTKRFYETVIVDVNGSDGPNSVWNANLGNVPDRFVFYITASGDTIPADPYGKMYIDRRKYWGKDEDEAVTGAMVNPEIDLPTMDDLPDVEASVSVSESQSTSESVSESESQSTSDSVSESDSVNGSSPADDSDRDGGDSSGSDDDPDMYDYDFDDRDWDPY